MTNVQFGQLIGEFKGVQDKLHTLSNLITGNGEPEKGLVTRLDRVEQRIRRVNWVVKTVVAAAIMAACTFLADLIIKSL